MWLFDFYVVRLRSFSQKSKLIYVGMSREPDNRLLEHNAKKVKSTQFHAPWISFFLSEPIENSVDARKIEKYYKSAAGKRKLNVIMNQFNGGSLPDC